MAIAKIPNYLYVLGIGQTCLLKSYPDMEKEMATHSSVLAWRIPGMEWPDGLQSMGLQRVGHD